MSQADQSPRRLRQALDAVVYAVAVTGAASVVLGVVSVVLGSGLVGLKAGLFLVGLLMGGYATFLLLPERPWDTRKTGDGSVEIVRRDDSKDPIGSREETKFQAMVQRLPPLTRYSIPPEERLSPGAKLFIASLVVLGTSATMEFVFGVGISS